ncbi:hypothetical protein JCM15519_18200 [Fundidesulfovibrio butyratiphilus]
MRRSDDEVPVAQAGKLAAQAGKRPRTLDVASGKQRGGDHGVLSFSVDAWMWPAGESGWPWRTEPGEAFDEPYP